MRSTSALALMMASLAVGALSACGDGDKKDNTPDSGTSSGNGKCPASAYICENFDNGDNGWKQPDDFHFATVTIDGSRTRSGSGAVHVVTEAGHNEEPFEPGKDEQAIAHLRKDIPQFGTKLYARAYVYLSRSSPPGVMGTYFILFSPNDNDFGGIELQGLPNGGFALDNWTGRGTGWNYQDEDPVVVKVSPNRWTCIEWGVERDSATAETGHAMAWADGQLAYDFPNVGMRPFTNFAVGYGFVHPKGDSESETWIDDLVVAPERIGCE
ncbi:hypothetical protein D7X55_17015 [Corallococcus sp. AB049A]|uniref:Glycoside hydrolase n=1 Tax=Corallococcus interemptor TaxID=2316720 RepID=A0A3A8QIH8_9BACT|nr:MULTISPECIES: hypothetical protein [Corallococcus]RKH44838.1 hypothetical protein D7Y23_26845 [Corallococcus sp. AB050B]RKH67521.1 hypothetical protein D7X96_19235 [Corallococcus interemptor]RKI65004.1 hypothetical protein D7X55_17015 [Corallococcus sp. AB049A]